MDHQPSPVLPVGPTGPGALAGFESRCTCGLVIRSSLLTIAQADVREHVQWAARKGAARRGR